MPSRVSSLRFGPMLTLDLYSLSRKPSPSQVWALSLAYIRVVKIMDRHLGDPRLGVHDHDTL